VQPVKVFVETPEYVMDSESITIVPVDVKPVAEVSTIDVALLLTVVFRVVTCEPVTTPPQAPAPQPVAYVYTSKPVLIWYVNVAVPPVPDDVAGAFTMMLYWFEFRYVI
jgi:hypothetical protein